MKRPSRFVHMGVLRNGVGTLLGVGSRRCFEMRRRGVHEEAV